MLRPSMYQIISKNDSYYEFVVAVSQRARDIADAADEEHVILTDKPVSVAVKEFAEGKVKVSDFV